MFFNIIILEQIIINFLFILPLLIVIAFFTLIERKLMASLQRRIGPNLYGYLGLFQPILDGIKLIFKEILIPRKSSSGIFLLAPIFMMIISFSTWVILPFTGYLLLFDSKFSLLVFLMLSSLNVYTIVLAGWSSNSKYAFLGAIRAIAQMISYELAFGVVILIFVVITGSLSFTDIVYRQTENGIFFFPLLPISIITFIIVIAETNRIPFDLPEAESELVAGYNVEYSSITFALFFLGEYSNILVMSTLIVILFFGNYNYYLIIWFSNFFFILKILFFCALFIFIRALCPRYRFDQLILVGWQVFLPVTFGFLCFILGLLLITNSLPLLNDVYLTPYIKPYG